MTTDISRAPESDRRVSCIRSASPTFSTGKLGAPTIIEADGASHINDANGNQIITDFSGLYGDNAIMAVPNSPMRFLADFIVLPPALLARKTSLQFSERSVKAVPGKTGKTF
ncbi:hypothetical protein [Rhizobium gallicum]|nr:hypothetical protein [Rhizobium gallicum]